MDQPSEHALAEATHWRLRMCSGSADTEERAAFEAWLASSAENKRAYNDLAKSAALIALAAASGKQRPGKRFNISVMVTALAAAIVLALVLARPAQPIRYHTEAGQQREARAGAGIAKLDTATTLLLAPNRVEARLVEGEVYFTAARALVRAGGYEVRGRDATFSVRWIKDELRVIVEDGAVDWAAAGQRRIHIEPGFQLIADGQGQALTPASPRALAWRDGWLDFDGETLATVIAEAQRYGAPPLIMDDERARDFPVVARFRIESARNLDQIINAHLPALEVVERNGALHVRSRTAVLSDL